MVRFKSVNFKQFTLQEREAFVASLTASNAEPQVFLQTCSRVEQYSGSGQVSDDVARYLFRLVAGLESSFIGETAIQGQVKKAYIDATERFKLSASLHKLFQNALRVGKRVRTESGISQGAMSHSQATIELLQRENIELETAMISLLGVNKLNEDIIRFLHAKKAYSIFLSNRTFDRAQELADKYECSAFQLNSKTDVFALSDVIISATSAPHLIIKPEHIDPSRQLLIIDLAFPRDVDPAIGLLPNVKLYDLDDVNQQLKQNIHSRTEQVKMAEQIIEEEVAKFCTHIEQTQRAKIVA
jgi:glutamyl-tRNA reductase